MMVNAGVDQDVTIAGFGTFLRPHSCHGQMEIAIEPHQSPKFWSASFHGTTLSFPRNYTSIEYGSSRMSPVAGFVCRKVRKD